jgi:hypothetical protein
MQAVGEVAQLLERLGELLLDAVEQRLDSEPGVTRVATMPRRSDSETSRCWAPSCRSRSSRRRALSHAAAMRAAGRSRVPGSWHESLQARRPFRIWCLPDSTLIFP